MRIATTYLQELKHAFWNSHAHFHARVRERNIRRRCGWALIRPLLALFAHLWRLLAVGRIQGSPLLDPSMRGPSSFDNRAPRMVLLEILNDKIEKLDILVAVELDPEGSVVNDLYHIGKHAATIWVQVKGSPTYMRSLVKPVEDTRLGDFNEMAVMGQRPVCRPLHDQLHF